MISEKSRRYIIKYSILGLLFINVVIMAILIADISYLSMSDRTLEIVGTLLSGFLTVVLILVYLDISLTQDDILDIQSSQETLMEHEKAPKLIADRLQYTAEDTFELVLSNLGGGYADGIRIQVVPEFYHWDSEQRELNQTSSGLLAYQEPLSRQHGESDQPSLVTKDNYLEGNESSVTFEFSLRFECDTDADGFFSDFDKKDDVYMRFHNLMEYSVASMEYPSMDTYMQSAYGGSGLSDEEISELGDDLPFNRLRMRFFVLYPGIEDTQPIEREIADRMIPFQTDLDTKAMWSYSKDFNEYSDQMQDNKNHMGGFDPIGAKISRDRTDF
jgi:hypothetical protein